MIHRLVYSEPEYRHQMFISFLNICRVYLFFINLQSTQAESHRNFACYLTIGFIRKLSLRFKVLTESTYANNFHDVGMVFVFEKLIIVRRSK